MIYWLAQSLQSHPSLRRGEPLPGLLGPPELERLSRLKIEKRRRDWLLGRWTAKHLVRRWLHATTGVSWPLDQIGVRNDPQGVPYITLASETREPGLLLSISHSCDLALCALAQPPQISALGIDLELAERRSLALAVDAFTPAELDRLSQAPPTWQPVFISAIWSAKEAVLKALQVGLTVDTRRVTCLLDLSKIPGPAWQPFACLHHIPGKPAVQGWWRLCNGFFFSLAVAAVIVDETICEEFDSFCGIPPLTMEDIEYSSEYFGSSGVNGNLCGARNEIPHKFPPKPGEPILKEQV